MRLAPLAVAALLPFAPALAQEQPNLTTAPPGPPGDLRSLLLAEQLFADGKRAEDALMVLAAVQLARGIGTRQATGWTRQGAPYAPAAEAEASPRPGATTQDPASDEAMALAVLMAEGNEPLADLAADIEASRARAAYGKGRVSEAVSDLPGGQEETWQLPFYGQSAAELAVMGDGASNLDVVVTDEFGTLVCAENGPEDRAYCAFTPQVNGYFMVTVINRGTETNRYRLMSN